MFTLSCFLLLGTFWASFVNGQNSLQYQNDTIIITEGENVALYCDFRGTTFNGLRWYKLNPGASPDHIIYAPSKTEKYEGRLSLTFNGDSCFLHIKDPRVSDSALYLCAVDAGFGKLTFGEGTKLLVRPKTEQNQPSVYKLKSSTSNENLPNSVCLITDFPSPNKPFQIDGKTMNLTDVSVLDESSDNKWRYSAVIWAKKDDNACSGKYGEEGSFTGIEPENDKETCSSDSIDKSFQTNPSLNTLSITVLAWRVLTIKAIIFNLILTLRLWSS